MLRFLASILRIKEQETHLNLLGHDNEVLYHSMMYLFKVLTQSISLIITQVCETVLNVVDACVKVRV